MLFIESEMRERPVIYLCSTELQFASLLTDSLHILYGKSSDYF